MRISDWSSDVCSSDLHPDTSLESRPATRPITVRNLLTHTAGLGYTIVTQGPLLKEYERLGITPGAINAAVEAQARPARPKPLAEFAERVATLPLLAAPGDRQSAVWGKRMSVRVDLGGGRDIKKK